MVQTERRSEPVRLETLEIRNFRAYRKTQTFVLGTDVTVYRETETRLRTALEQSDRFACLASRTVNGVIILNTEGRIEWVNPAWERFTGYTLAEAVGKRM